MRTRTAPRPWFPPSLTSTRGRGTWPWTCRTGPGTRSGHVPGSHPGTCIWPASVSILAPMGIVTSSFGAGIPAPILLFLRDNPSSYPPNTNRPKTATLIRRIPMWKTAFRPVLCLVAKIIERPLLIPCPAHQLRRASAPARILENQSVCVKLR